MTDNEYIDGLLDTHERMSGIGAPTPEQQDLIDEVKEELANEGITPGVQPAVHGSNSYGPKSPDYK